MVHLLYRFLVRTMFYPNWAYLLPALALHYAVFWGAARFLEPSDSEMHSAVGFFYYYFVTMLTVGYGDIAPKSEELRLLFVPLAVTGILLYMIILGKGVVVISDTVFQFKKGLMKAMEKNPVVCIGWRNGITAALLKEHASSRPEEQVGFIIVDDQLTECPNLGQIHRAAQFVKGSPHKLETLNRANVAGATCIYVCGRTDSDNIAIVSSLSHLEPACRVIVLLHDPDTTLPNTAMDLHITPPSSPERSVLSMNDPEAGRTINTLITTQDGSNAYQATVPDCIPRSPISVFRDAFEEIFGALLVRSGEHMLPCPTIIVEPGMVVVYVANQRIPEGNWDHLAAHLKH